MIKIPTNTIPEGQRIWFLLLHNIISGILIFSIGYPLGVYDKYYTSIWDWFSIGFLMHVLSIFALSLILSIIARFLGYMIYKIIMIYRIRKIDGEYRVIKRNVQIKSFWELTSGINSFLSFTFIIVNLLGAFVLAIGLFVIIYNRFFSAMGILGLLLVYVGLKIGLYLLSKRWSGKLT